MKNQVEKYIIVEILEKVYRLKKFIGTQKPLSKNNGNTPTVEVFEIALQKILETLNSPISLLYKNDLTDEERFALNRRLSTTFLLITEFHSKLKYIYTDWVRPETYTFTKRLLQQLPGEHSKLDLNIVLSDEYTFKENNLINKFNEILRKSKVTYISKDHNYPTLFLPKIEYTNPLNWAILAHEMAHINTAEVEAFIEDPGLIPPGTTNAHKEILKKWAEEIYCDIFAVNLLGPAYFASFVSFALATTGFGGNSINSYSHPSNMLRIRMIHEHMTRNNSDFPLPTEELGDFSVNSFFHTMIEDFDKTDRQLLGSSVENGYDIENLTHFVQFIRSYSKRFAHGDPIESTELDLNTELSKKLERGIPIGSHSTYNKDQVLIDLENKDNDFDDIKSAISERGTSIRSILNAGWSNKIVNTFPKINKMLFSSNPCNLVDCVTEIGRYIEESDDRLLKSIETSELYYLLETD
jgi:hypothetical protein